MESMSNKSEIDITFVKCICLYVEILFGFTCPLLFLRWLVQAVGCKVQLHEISKMFGYTRCMYRPTGLCVLLCLSVKVDSSKLKR